MGTNTLPLQSTSTCSASMYLEISFKGLLDGFSQPEVLLQAMQSYRDKLLNDLADCQPNELKSLVTQIKTLNDDIDTITGHALAILRQQSQSE